jgi:3-isopropylmalate dehydratase small subunit
MNAKDDFGLANNCLIRTHPEFRSRVSQGYNIVVAGIGIGCGSSREEAPRAIRGKRVGDTSSI